MRHIFKHKYTLLIVGVALLVRILMTATFPNLVIEPDSENYYTVGTSILTLPNLKHIINPNRTPGYPVFVASMISLKSRPPDFGTSGFKNGARTLLVAQMLLGIAASVLWFHILLLMKLPKRVAFFAVYCASATSPSPSGSVVS